MMVAMNLFAIDTTEVLDTEDFEGLTALARQFGFVQLETAEELVERATASGILGNVVTQELPSTRRQVSVEQALLLSETVRLYWGDECIRRPGNYPNAKWVCGSHKANTLIELIAYLALTRNV